ncbi:MAG: prephenate dehydrogenase [Corynebacterium sp.]|nr:prephenate dehydrogenase [Corynebacterium sp.]
MSIRQISRPVCILGLGLIGGSLLRALKAQDVTVFGYNRSPSGAQAAAQDGYDASSDLVATLTRAAEVDALIVLSTPMPAIGALLDAIATYAPECGFTDVVSVKERVYELVNARGLADRYVGSHPMAGTAESGWGATRADLFQGAVWVITYDYALEHTPDARWIGLWTDVAAMAGQVGSNLVPARVHQHDAAVARISHLPHLLAEALAITGDHGGALALSLAAGSFRDGTRVASTNPSLVRAMCETNAAALRAALDETLSLLHDAREHLSGPDVNLEELIDTGYRSRIRFEAHNQSPHSADSSVHISPHPVFRVHPGGPNWINQLKQAEMIGANIEVVRGPSTPV